MSNGVGPSPPESSGSWQYNWDDVPMVTSLIDWPLPDARGTAIVVNPTKSWWSYMFCAETAVRLVEDGWQVHWLDCSDASHIDDSVFHVNPQDKPIRWKYKDPALSVRHILARRGVVIETVIGTKSAPTKPYPQIGSRAELLSTTLDGVPVGAIVAASISGQSFTRYFDPTQYRHEISLQFTNLMSIADVLSTTLTRLRPDLVATTNDRLAPAALALSLARRKGIGTLVSYWGCDSSRFMAYRSSLYSQDDWRRHIEGADSHDCNSALEEPLEEVINASNRNVYAERMRPGLVPAKVAARRIVVFTNTPWEYSGVLDSETHGESDQIALVGNFLSAIADSAVSDVEVVIRHHPLNPDIGDRSEWEAWNAIRGIFPMREIPSEDPVDSYELAATADLCVVWRSSIGMELMLSGRPVVALDDVYWLPRDSPYIVRDSDSIRAAVEKPPTPPGKDFFRPLALFQQGWGVPFRHTSGHGFDVELCGERIFRRRLMFRLMRKVRRPTYSLFRGCGDLLTRRRTSN